MTTAATQRPITIRDITAIEEMREVEELQRHIWGIADREVFPALALVPMIELGAVLLGAFAGDQMAGFVFGFPGLEQGHVMLHSDMLAVRPEYRSAGLGYKLKLAQRDRANGAGLNTISWTFDPLQAVNANLNIGKLGAIADQYRINYYGETTSFLHRNGTDRLWLTWQLNSERVKERIANSSGANVAAPTGIPAIVSVGSNEQPVSNAEVLDQAAFVIEIPGNINALVDVDASLAVDWREATREAFTKLFTAGFVVTDFHRVHRDGRGVGRYLLRKGQKG
jgi:predicted GNAT superfamily acetyltransferase